MLVTGVKESSFSSFPSDHGEIILQWICMLYAFGSIRYVLLALPGALFFLLPRLISGAHWFLDIFAGSMMIASFISFFATQAHIYKDSIKLLSNFSKKNKESSIYDTI